MTAQFVAGMFFGWGVALAIAIAYQAGHRAGQEDRE